MRSSNESDVVCEQQNTSAATKAFNNWINSEEPREEFKSLVHDMSLKGVDSGHVRYMLQYGYQGGFNSSTEAAALQEVATSADVGTSPTVTRGTFGGIAAEEFLVHASNLSASYEKQQLLRIAAYVRVLEEQAGVK